MSHPQLLVGLESKLARASRHWLLVDQALPPKYPLVLLSGVECGGLDGLAGRLPGLRFGVLRAEMKLKLVRGEYERGKGEVHGWLKRLNVWRRANVQGTRWMLLWRRVPGRGQSYWHWWKAAIAAWVMWKLMEEEPPDIVMGWPMDLGEGRTLARFEEAVRALATAHDAVLSAEAKVTLARGSLEMAQQEAADLLVAYGAGVRARLGQRGALVRSIPRWWPRRAGKG